MVRVKRVSLVAIGSVMCALAVSSAAAQGTPTAHLYGWGATEGWIVCPATQKNCHESPQQVKNSSGTSFVAIDASDSSNLAIDTSGNVWAWGNNQDGQLGNGTTKASTAPVEATGISNAVATATGNSDALALLSNGKVWAWGNNPQGQLGTGNTTSSLVPVPATAVNNYVAGLGGGVSITAIAAGGNKAYALLSNGTVIAWGFNEDGELGNGTTVKRSVTPVVVQGLPSDIAAISSGNLFGDALTAGGTVYDWGNNQFGQLGNGKTANSSVAVPVSGLDNVVQISAGGDAPTNGHNMALLGNGTVMTWGDNQQGQLGNGKTVNSSVPVPVTGLTDGTSADVVAIGAGGLHSMALLSDGTVMTWGDNQQGQLGNGTTVNSSVPVAVLNNVELISAGAVDSLAALKPSG